jgi:succinate dehydrogenase/fumarate reductase flavoprotein subunit
MLSYGKAFWRTHDNLETAQARLDDVWAELDQHRHAEGLDQVAARETAALVATARWSTSAALARNETRGMHVRADAPGLAPDGARRLLVGGLDSVWTRFETTGNQGLVSEIAA